MMVAWGMPAPVSSTTTSRSWVWLFAFCAASGARNQQRRGDRRVEDGVSFGERVRLEVRIDLVALDHPLFVRLAAHTAGDEMRELDAVDRLVFSEMHLEGDGRTLSASPAYVPAPVCGRASCRRLIACCASFRRGGPD